MEICIENFDSGLLKESEKEREARQSKFLPVCPKIAPRKVVDDAQLALGRGVVNDKLLIHDTVAQPRNPYRDVFASNAVVPLPHREQSSIVVAEDAGAEVDDPPKRKYMCPDMDLASSGLPVSYEASQEPMNSRLLFLWL